MTHEPRPLLDGPATFAVAQEVIGERARQDQNGPLTEGRCRTLLEQGTAALQSGLRLQYTERSGADEYVRDALIRLSAFAQAWIEAIDRRRRDERHAIGAPTEVIHIRETEENCE